MNEIALKYNQLSKSRRKQIIDFMDFLLARQNQESKILLSDYKKKILTVSTWNEEDSKKIEENQKAFRQWNIQEW